jgi:hypothetical protein
MLGDEASHFNVDDQNQTLAQAAGGDTAQQERISLQEGCSSPEHVGSEVRKESLGVV